MTAPSSTAFLEAALRERGLLPVPDRAVPAPGPGRPWFVSVLLGASGWLAGLFCLAFVTLLFRPTSAGELLPFGVVLLVGAFALYRAPAGAFLEQLALAFAVAGHVAVAIAIGATTRSSAGTALGVAAIQAGWLVAVPNRLSRTLSACAAAIAWALAVRFALTGDTLDPWRRAAVALAPALASWLVAWGPAAGGAAALVATELRWVAGGRARLVRPALVGLLLALSFGTVVSVPPDGVPLALPDAAPRTSWVALWPLLSISTAVLALGCAHRLRSRALVGAAIAGALLHVFHFYLLVGTTLLVKSAIMAIVGVVLLAGAVRLDRRGGAR